MWRTRVCATIAAGCAFAFGCAEANHGFIVDTDNPIDEPTLAAKQLDCPVSAVLLGRTKGKPPLRFHSLHLTLLNKRAETRWFLLPDYGNVLLPENGVFKPEFRPIVEFGIKRYEGEGGSVVEIEAYGGNGFRAFRLAPAARVVLDGYTLTADTDVDLFDVTVARELLVNGRVPLEEWLDFETLSDSSVRVHSDTLKVNWQSPKPRKSDHTKGIEPVGFVQLKEFVQWRVKMAE